MRPEKSYAIKRNQMRRCIKQPSTSVPHAIFAQISGHDGAIWKSGDINQPPSRRKQSRQFGTSLAVNWAVAGHQLNQKQPVRLEWHILTSAFCRRGSSLPQVRREVPD